MVEKGGGLNIGLLGLLRHDALQVAERAKKKSMTAVCTVWTVCTECRACVVCACMDSTYGFISIVDQFVKFFNAWLPKCK